MKYRENPWSLKELYSPSCSRAFGQIQLPRVKPESLLQQVTAPPLPLEHVVPEAAPAGWADGREQGQGSKGAGWEASAPPARRRFVQPVGPEGEINDRNKERKVTQVERAEPNWAGIPSSHSSLRNSSWQARLAQSCPLQPR